MCWYRNRKAELEYRVDEGMDDRENYLCCVFFFLFSEIRNKIIYQGFGEKEMKSLEKV